jgi:hypothetical protein
MKCLMIETKDKRKFFTSKSNFMQLSEFIKVFKPNVFLVDMKKGEMLELNEIASLLCETEYKKETEHQYEIVEEIKIEEKKSSRNKVDSQKIKEFIKKELLNKKTISIKKLKNRFKKYELSDSTYYNQIKSVKMELSKQGFKFIKVKKKS